jgi:HSP20 family protein
MFQPVTKRFERSMGDLLHPFDFVWSNPLFDYEKKTKKTKVDMPVKIIEDSDQIRLEAVIPGVKQEDIDLTYEDNVLTVKISQKTETKEEKESVILDEHFDFACSRSFVIYDINIDESKATLKDGILLLTLPKSESVKPKKIEVK